MKQRTPGLGGHHRPSRAGGPHLLALGLLAAGCSSLDELPEPEPEPWPEPVCIDEAVPDHEYLGVEDETFLAGPYLMHTTEQSTVLMWQTDDACDAEVRYGTEPDSLSSTVTFDDPARQHEVELAGLTAQTRYYYRASSCGESTELLDFYTAPERGGALRFTVWGDSQSNPEQAYRTTTAMLARAPLFDLHVGDVLGSGDVEEQWIDEFLVPLRPLGHHVPTYVSIGNHERNDPSFYEVVSYPTSVADDLTGESYYSFTYGNAFVLVVDTNKLFYDLDVGGGEVMETVISGWIKSQLSSEAARTAMWRIALGHESAVSESWSPGDCSYDGNVHVRDWLLPLLSANRFHAYFAGHTHAYERGMVDGVLHVITGGGGGGLDEWCVDLPETDVVALTHHYLTVEADCSSLSVTARETDTEELIDQVVLEADRWGEIAEQQTP